MEKQLKSLAVLGDCTRKMALRAAKVAMVAAAASAVVAGCGQKGPLIPLRDAGTRNLPVTTLSPMSSSTGSTNSPSMQPSAASGPVPSPSPSASSAKP